MKNNEVKVTFEDATESKVEMIILVDEVNQKIKVRTKFEPGIDLDDCDNSPLAHAFAVVLLEKLKSL